MIPKLLSLLANVRLAHWQADSRTNAHKTLGDLYARLDSLIDELVEIDFGKRKTRQVDITETIDLIPGIEIAELIESGLELVSDLESSCEPSKDSDSLNTLADIRKALNQARFLLMI